MTPRRSLRNVRTKTKKSAISTVELPRRAGEGEGTGDDLENHQSDWTSEEELPPPAAPQGSLPSDRPDRRK